MKVENKGKKGVMVVDIDTGDCFINDNELYMKLDDEQLSDGENINCVSLECATLECIDDFKIVNTVNVKAVIE